MRTILAVLFLSVLVGCASAPTPPQLGIIVFPKEVLVPAVGSTTIKQVTRDGKTRPPEVMVVRAHQDGRPIFAGKVFNHEGSMAETATGAVVWTDDCPTPAELALPPVIPNKCDWTVCYPPQAGTTYLQTVRFYVPLLACTARDGTLTVTTVGTTTIETYGAVVHTKAKLTVTGLPEVTWDSYIKPGFGEVSAKSTHWSSVYVDTPKRRSVVFQNRPPHTGGLATAQAD